MKPSSIPIWPMLVPLTPLVMGMVLLQIFGIPALELPTEFANSLEFQWKHAGDRLELVTSTTLHVFVSLMAVGYCGFVIEQEAKEFRSQIYRAILMLGVPFVVAMGTLAHWWPTLIAYQFSYANIRDVLSLSYITTTLTTGQISTLAIYVLLPSAFGIFAVLMAAGVTSGILRKSDPISKETLSPLLKKILNTFYILSAVLVTSSMTAGIFFHMPLELLAPASDAYKGLSAYADSLTLFWGTIYTLTLFSAYIGPLSVLYIRTRHIGAKENSVFSPIEWFKEHDIAHKAGDLIKNVMVLLAPIAVGPIGDVIQLAVG